MNEAVPQRPVKKKLYYGWVIVGVIILIGLVQTGQFNPTIGVFIKPVTEQYGWSRSTFVGAVTLGTLLAGVSSVVLGPLLDRYGPRWMVTIGIVAIGASAVGMAFVHELWQLYLWVVLGRFAVQGGIQLALTVTVSKWFVKKRGRAVAISGLGVRLGNGVTPLYTQAFVSGFGWRVATVALGILTWAVALVPSFLLLRRQPEDMGLRPDGETAEDAKAVPQTAKGGKKAGRAPEMSFTLKQVLRMPVFYLLTMVIVLMQLVGPGLNLHFIPYFTDQGIDARKAAVIVTVWSLVGGVGGLFIGYIVERVSIRYTYAACFGLGAMGIALLMQVHSTMTGFLFSVYHGLIFGAMMTLFNLIVPEYFGRGSLGAIRGITTPIQLGGNALSPLLASLVYDHTGSYTIIFWVFMGCYVLAGLILCISRPPAQKGRTDPEAAAAKG